jgi:xylulokinase
MLLLGYDIGSSSVKASIIDAETASVVASAFQPKQEMPINAPMTGWAEQDPESWWKNLKLATGDVLQSAEIDPDRIGAIGISYQMHGLVIVDKDYNVLRPAIIWCDSLRRNWQPTLPQQSAEFPGKFYCLETQMGTGKRA